jgi:hypothetical protein
MTNLRDQTGEAASGSARCAIAVFAVLLALTSGAGRATAADVRLFQLTDVSGFVELGFLTHIQDRSRTSSPSSALNRVEFSQLLNASARGYVYHPSFLTLQGGLQIEFIEDVLNQGDYRILPGGDLRLDFLQNHRNGVSIFGRVLSAEQVRAFSEKYDVLSQLYGATFYQRWGWIPFSLTFQHRSMDSSGPGSFDDSAEEILFRGSYELGEQSRGNIDYDLSFQDRRGDDVRRQDLAVNNTSYFGDEGEKRLATSLIFNEEIAERVSGKSKRYSVNGSTNFDWQHTDDLSTDYRLAGRWSDFGSQSVTSLNPSFLITHELYESLTSQVEIFGRLRDGSTGSRNEVAGSISEAYVKRLGGWGRLSIRATPRVAMTYDRPKGDSAPGFVEDYQMKSDPDLARELPEPNIIESTIRVFSDDCEFVECVPGWDYLVQPVGGGVFKLSLPLFPGDLGEDALVLVEYKSELGGRGDILSTSVDVGASLWILERLALFGSYQTNDRKVVSGNERDVRINSYDRSTVGLELTWPWLSARAELEDYDATFSPFRGYLGRISVFSGSTASWRARGGVGYVFRDYSDTGETLGRLTASAGVRKRLFRRGRLELEARYQRVRWSGERSAANNVDTLSVDAGFSWWYGKIDVKLEGGMVQILRSVEDKREYRVDLRVRRPF